MRSRPVSTAFLIGIPVVLIKRNNSVPPIKRFSFSVLMRSSGMPVARVAQFKQILSISFNSNFYPASLAGNLKTDNRHVALQIYLYIVYGIWRGSGE